MLDGRPGGEAAHRPRIGRISIKVVVSGLMVALALLYLVFTAAQGATAYYLTVGEMRALGPSERLVRIAGEVRGETIAWDARALVLTFEIADESGALPVVYRGPRPDMFQDGATAIVEGQYNDAQGVFEARELLLQCPSKYEGEG